MISNRKTHIGYLIFEQKTAYDIITFFFFLANEEKTTNWMLLKGRTCGKINLIYHNRNFGTCVHISQQCQRVGMVIY